MWYHVIIDCEGTDDKAYEWPQYPNLSDVERDDEEENWCNIIGYFYAGAHEADTPAAAIAAAKRWIADNKIDFCPGA